MRRSSCKKRDARISFSQYCSEGLPCGNLIFGGALACSYFKKCRKEAVFTKSRRTQDENWAVEKL